MWTNPPPMTFANHISEYKQTGRFSCLFSYNATYSCAIVGGVLCCIMLEYFQKGGAVVALTSIITMLFAWINLILVIGFGFLVVKFLISGIKYFSSKNNTQQKTVRHNLGDLLKDYRIKNNMTQEFAAQRLGVSRQAVSKWENGTSDPSTSNLIAIAKLYNVPPEEILQQIK